MRLFIALPLSAGMKREIGELQAGMRAQGVRGRWTPSDMLHVTLAFIGEQEDPGPALKALRSVRFDGFSIRLDRIGHFGDLWWAGFSASPELERLAGSVRRALKEAGIPFDEKPFRAHVTLLRRGSFPPGYAPPHVAGDAKTEAESVFLMRSDRGEKGMVYTRIGGISAKDRSE